MPLCGISRLPIHVGTARLARALFGCASACLGSRERSWQRARGCRLGWDATRRLEAARQTSETARGAPKNSSLIQYQHKSQNREHRHARGIAVWARTGAAQSVPGLFDGRVAIAVPWPRSASPSPEARKTHGDLGNWTTSAKIGNSRPTRRSHRAPTSLAPETRPWRRRRAGLRIGGGARGHKTPCQRPAASLWKIFPVRGIFSKERNVPPPIPCSTCWFPGGQPSRSLRATGHRFRTLAPLRRKCCVSCQAAAA
jgi:hypothetical protein